MIETTARRDFEYDNTYNRALQSRVYNCLRDTVYADLHEKTGIKLFSYSPPIPPRNATKGDTRRFIFAGQDEDLITAIASDLCKNPELDLYEMAFRVDRAFSIDNPLGEQGTLTTGSPLIIRFDQDSASEYNVETKYEKTYWQPEHGTELFFECLHKNLQRKFRLVFDADPPEPPYFTGYSFNRTVAKPLEFNDESVTFIGSEWSFDYEIRSGPHRKLLNLAFDCGLGELNALGFGFMNREVDVNGCSE
ncbi:CRISPR-associated endoribonuclease Cas6 [Natronococcus sp. A-GB1]|uniref:CRISPR-associated endoribonuclease Cas6 n=1 Tax=Natronococcus sp. A-GB1 TaxID=3037648 RepID=UPI00241F043D|nr:CRISPR-associated endoribonuclease Cas6 [Natronococcus sp. A-GB1]MDG5762061.1 CRISPR-associated endoribonuclease Cas6 [Natronococcus sp. A-GB1]